MLIGKLLFTEVRVGLSVGRGVELKVGRGVLKNGSPLKGSNDESKGATIFPLPWTKLPADRIVLFFPILTFPSTTVPIV